MHAHESEEGQLTCIIPDRLIPARLAVYSAAYGRASERAARGKRHRHARATTNVLDFAHLVQRDEEVGNVGAGWDTGERRKYDSDGVGWLEGAQ